MVFAADILAWERWDSGLGLIPGLAVLPHFDRRDGDAVARAEQTIAERGLVGLGIDESTAAIWHRGAWQVSGRGRIVVLTPDGVREFREGETIEALPEPM
jgi:cyanophycinase-like exopeptidase